MSSVTDDKKICYKKKCVTSFKMFSKMCGFEFLHLSTLHFFFVTLLASGAGSGKGGRRGGKGLGGRRGKILVGRTKLGDLVEV